MKAIISASEEEIQRLTRIWVYGSGFQTDNDGFPFLFINGGAATLSGSALGIAMIKDTVTQREIQSLEHAGTRRFYFSVEFFKARASGWRLPYLCNGTSRFLFEGGDRLTVFLSAKAYHVSNGTWSIATADRGPDATIKVWTAQRSLQSQVSGGSNGW